uniref:Striatin N-terminal domain-containing protein n=1 Tax=Guillardia theta TaxID=55529 RepID=A0A7S4NMF3_GUITH|mmetsp:Transcript_25836/g.85110  ORF Transcript_25836/g.85110 Transcript_25836/m.85110 type:complete len:517 (+) Transcript_25836:72-1622(+)
MSAIQSFLQDRPKYTMQGVISYLESFETFKEMELDERDKKIKVLEEKLKAVENELKIYKERDEESARRIEILELALKMERQSTKEIHTNKFCFPQNFDGASTVLLKAAREKEEDVEVEARAEIVCTEGEQVDDMSAFFGNKLKPFEESTTEIKGYREFASLRSHMDSINDLSWNSNGSLLLSASEDGCLKLWCLKSIKAVTKASNTVPDIEPLITYRGHNGAVNCGITVSAGRGDPNGFCVSGGLDGSVRLWDTPKVEQDLYDSVGCSVRNERMCYTYHSDAVWAITYTAKHRFLISGSADGIVKGWSIGDLLETKDSELIEGGNIQDHDRPAVHDYRRQGSLAEPGVAIAIETSPQDADHFFALYDNGAVADFDVASQTVRLDFLVQSEHNSSTPCASKAPSCLAVHPTFPLAVIGHLDSVLTAVDLSRGKTVFQLPAHDAPVVSVTIDGTGLYVMTGGADGTCRVWDLRKQRCVCESRLEASKFGNRSIQVAANPCKKIIAVGSVDARVSLLSS